MTPLLKRKFNYDQLDAGENISFQRLLEAFIPELFNTEFPALLARTMLPVDYSAGPGTKQITYRAYTMIGLAQAIANYSSDAPMADAFGQEFTSKTKDYGIGWQWSIAEIKAAARMLRAGIGPTMPLDEAKAQASREGAETTLDNVAFGGDAALGIIGLNTIPGANTVALPNGAAGSPLWVNKTADEMLADLFLADTTALTNSNEVESPTRLIMPPVKFRLASQTRVSIASDTTVMEFFQKQARCIKEVMPWWKLENAGSGGAIDRMISYRPDKSKIRLAIPEEYNTLPPEARNFAFIINAMMTIGGVICPRPVSVTYLDGL